MKRRITSARSRARGIQKSQARRAQKSQARPDQKSQARRVRSSQARRDQRSQARRIQKVQRTVIVLVYTLVFWGCLPAGLVIFGLAVDEALVLSSPAVSVRVFGGIVASVAAPTMLRAIVQISLRGRGLPISHLPPAVLVASGTYARCRHPIYVAYNATFVGLGLAFGSWGVGFGGGALLLGAWVAYATLSEEPRLRARYGVAYKAYADSTPIFPALFGRRRR